MSNGTAAAIVVGVDGSQQSVEALRWAARIAPSFGAGIRAVGAWDYPPEYAGYVPLGSDNFDEVTQKQVDQAVREAVGDDVPAGLTTSVVFGHPRRSWRTRARTPRCSSSGAGATAGSAGCCWAPSAPRASPTRSARCS